MKHKPSAIAIKQAQQKSVEKGTAGRQEHKGGAASSNKGSGGKLAR